MFYEGQVEGFFSGMHLRASLSRIKDSSQRRFVLVQASKSKCSHHDYATRVTGFVHSACAAKEWVQWTLRVHNANHIKFTQAGPVAADHRGRHCFIIKDGTGCVYEATKERDC